MKKFSIAFIILLAIIAITVVGIYGVHITADNVTTYVANIECKHLLFNEKTCEVTYDPIDQAYVINRYDIEVGSNVRYIDFEDNLEFGIYYNVYPDNASDKGVEIIFSDNELANLNGNLIHINPLSQERIEENPKWVILYIYLIASDGSNVSTQLNILFKRY